MFLPELLAEIDDGWFELSARNHRRSIRKKLAKEAELNLTRREIACLEAVQKLLANELDPGTPSNDRLLERVEKEFAKASDN